MLSLPLRLWYTRAMKEEIISLTKVNKFYGHGGGRQQVLHDLTLTINHGDFISIVGTSGSGKTTLLNIVGGLDRRYDGTCVVDGKQVEKLDDKRLARLRNETLGFVFQSFNLMEHLTCWENVALSAFFQGSNIPQSQIYSRAVEVLERFGLHDKIHSQPANLSGGQKQRVAIARTLLNNSRILIFDDSLSAVDVGTDAVIREQLRQRCAGTTTFIVSHRVSTLRDADRILVLDGGRLAQEGTHEELLRRDGIYKRVSEMQELGDKS
jgi:putative ABC transport system ATP-binding protein